MDRVEPPGNAGRQHRALHLPAVRRPGIPHARGAVRKLVVAVGDHPDRADVFAVCDWRRLAARDGQ